MGKKKVLSEEKVKSDSPMMGRLVHLLIFLCILVGIYLVYKIIPSTRKKRTSSNTQKREFSKKKKR